MPRLRYKQGQVGKIYQDPTCTLNWGYMVPNNIGT